MSKEQKLRELADQIKNAGLLLLAAAAGTVYLANSWWTYGLAAVLAVGGFKAFQAGERTMDGLVSDSFK